MAALEAGLDRLRLAQEETNNQMKHTDQSLGILIRMMDEWIRNSRRNGPGPEPAGA